MKRRFVRAILLACLLFIMTPACSQASLADRLQELRTQVEGAQHNFWLWLDKDNSAYAQWERVSGGVNFRIKMENQFPEDSVDAYTFEISAKDVYEEPILLKSSDGEYCESLYYTGERTFKPGGVGYTEYFNLRAKEKIRYVDVTLIKYHTDEGTINIDKSHQKVYNWKIK